ncbi:DNA-directed RNA polymerase subunit omega [Terribacillus saccharophilus]|uniref:DNA-directed RNA polymerase subunit omega n=1 Tax=Terribacillus saccharophilus TaxID=361277 RepID=A0A268AAA3_9BACI|nr:DNA-directed RNA polymerase subunit omega [Terribacillus saccharophilus]PAD21050.1 DNA-directed RNA polymerase subunit omega [Terribacillus saccharophilus]PAF17363.1 DNA-directed RNA polymerase subunit omega [Terribacillus saccharophilus]PAF22132.1 DNA-directed RNA polymerase subunit omega [Terribacillus saccharophilus]PAF38323.1 DNA-directed RNA polymerase subunit omega [Terribacillus saccharophilus]PAF40236.1 DNA-directed RNA polymerase subunit omega [Terribacillus saccharophilus]
MMLEPSIDKLQEKIYSKYTLVTLSSQRARQLQETKTSKIANPKSFKYVGIALEEIQADKLEYTEE